MGRKMISPERIVRHRHRAARARRAAGREKHQVLAGERLQELARSLPAWETRVP
jgi:hypothetical protein